MCLFQMLVWEQKKLKVSIAQTPGIEMIILRRYKPPAIAVKYLYAAKAFLLLLYLWLFPMKEKLQEMQ